MNNQRADLRCSSSATDSDGETPRALTVFYDGACPLCTAEIGFYRRRRGAEHLDWVDVSACPTEVVAPSLSRQQALKRFHVRDAGGRLVSGGQAFAVLWSAFPAFAWIGAGCSAQGPSPGPLTRPTTGFWRGGHSCRRSPDAPPRMADKPLRAMERKIATLVTGNSSWWKQRKYRRETASALKRLRSQGWQYCGMRRLPQQGADTRRFSEYAFAFANDALPSAGERRSPATG